MFNSSSCSFVHSIIRHGRRLWQWITVPAHKSQNNDRNDNNKFCKSEPGPLRELGCVETYQLALQTLAFLRGIVLTANYTLPDSLIIGQAALPEALHDCFERAICRVILFHPYLRVGIGDENTKYPRWKPLSHINLEETVKWQTFEGEIGDQRPTLIQSLARDLDLDFQHRQLPGWRIVVLHNVTMHSIDVAFIFNHTHIDGNSAKMFHQDLLQSLKLEQKRAIHIQKPQVEAILQNHILHIPHNATFGLSPPPEKIVPFPIEQNLTFETASTVESDHQWAPIDSQLPYRSQFRTISVDSDQLSHLLRTCRNHQTKLTALIHASAFNALAPLLTRNGTKSLKGMTAIDIRRFLPPEHQRNMSNCVTIINHDFRTEVSEAAEMPWPIAEKVQSEINHKLNRQGLKNDMIGYALEVRDWQKELLDTAARQTRPAAWVITNLGVLDGESSNLHTHSSTPSVTFQEESDLSEWTITQSDFVMSANVVSAVFSIAMVTVKGGSLAINCTWQEGVVENELAEGFVHGLERQLMSVSD